MNVLRNQWSVSGHTVAVIQLSGFDEMGRVGRGVPSSRPGHQLSLKSISRGILHLGLDRHRMSCECRSGSTF